MLLFLLALNAMAPKWYVQSLPLENCYPAGIYAGLDGTSFFTDCPNGLVREYSLKGALLRTITRDVKDVILGVDSKGVLISGHETYSIWPKNRPSKTYEGDWFLPRYYGDIVWQRVGKHFSVERGEATVSTLPEGLSFLAADPWNDRVVVLDVSTGNIKLTAYPLPRNDGPGTPSPQPIVIVPKIQAGDAVDVSIAALADGSLCFVSFDSFEVSKAQQPLLLSPIRKESVFYLTRYEPKSRKVEALAAWSASAHGTNIRTRHSIIALDHGRALGFLFEHSVYIFRRENGDAPK